MNKLPEKIPNYVILTLKQLVEIKPYIYEARTEFAKSYLIDVVVFFKKHSEFFELINLIKPNQVKIVDGLCYLLEKENMLKSKF